MGLVPDICCLLEKHNPTFLLHTCFKGGYLDFSHLTELKNIYINEIYMKKQYRSSRIKNHKITYFFMGFP